MQKNGSRKGVSENKQDEKVAHKWERRGLDPASQIQESLEHHEEREKALSTPPSTSI